jgi:hypothetical protein
MCLAEPCPCIGALLRAFPLGAWGEAACLLCAAARRQTAAICQRVAIESLRCLWYVLGMIENIENAMFEILKPIQVHVSGLKADMSDIKTRIGGLEVRLDKLETLVRKQGRDGAAMLVMTRSIVGTYDERLKMIEEDVGC